MSDSPVDPELIKEWLEAYRKEDPWNFTTNVYERIRHRAMLEMALLNNPKSVLDLGCGEGHFLQLLLKTKPDINAVGVEIVDAAAARARERFKSQPVEIVNKDITEFLQNDPLAKKQYDLIILGEVLYYFLQADQIDFIIKSVADILSVNGRVLLSNCQHNFPDWISEILTRFEKNDFSKKDEVTLCTWIITSLTRK